MSDVLFDPIVEGNKVPVEEKSHDEQKSQRHFP